MFFASQQSCTAAPLSCARRNSARNSLIGSIEASSWYTQPP